jgi:hypothetical protein
MIIAHYGHRLPAAYDLDQVRQRTSQRGPVWDSRPDLYFKAFLLRENGRYGAIANSFSSLYLWRADEAFRDWLASGGFKIVTDSFGRAEIATRVVLDARKGCGGSARFAYREDIDIPVDADLTATFAQEIDRNRDLATHRGTIAAAIGVDTQNWKLTRLLLSENEPNDAAQGMSYQILHLARPLLDALPPA